MSTEHTCIVLRLRRTVVEDAYVAVPMTSAIMKSEPEPDGTYRIDFEAFVREAAQLSEHASVEWQREESAVQPHPTQQPVPEGRRVYDVHTES